MKSTFNQILYFLGDTSAGKTTLINRFLGCEILVPRTKASTAVVYRIRNSEKFQTQLYSKENKLLDSKDFVDASSMLNNLRSYTELDKMKTVKGESIHFVDIYLPSDVLQVILKTCLETIEFNLRYSYLY